MDLNLLLPESTIFIGRTRDLNNLLQDLEEDRKSIRILTGDSGIGKSKLLDEYYNKVRDKHKNTYFVGYYDNKKSLIAEGSYYLYPFNECLSNLIITIKENQTSPEQIKLFSRRLANSIKSYAKETGKELVIAIADDIIRKVGLEQTASILKKFIPHWQKMKTALSETENFISRQKEDIFNLYLNIFTTLSNEFHNRKFLLFFDQFEYVGKDSVNFLLNLMKRLPDTFHFLVAFKTPDRRWKDETIRNLYTDTYDKIIYDLKGKFLQLEGLTPEEIGEWVFKVKKIQLPLIPNLTRIRENSGGLPIILEKWIQNSENLHYDEIDKKDYCQQIDKLQKILDDEDKIRVRKMSILYPTTDQNFLTSYLNFSHKENLSIFLERLIDIEIFDQNKQWFRHELLQECFREILRTDLKTEYYQLASNLFDKFYFGKQIESYDEERYKLDLYYSSYLHYSKNYTESFYQNNRTANNAIVLIDLDHAERCYRRALEAATNENNIPRSEIINCLENLTKYVLYIWGRYDEALTNYSKVIEYYSDINDEKGLAFALNFVGAIYAIKGEYALAIPKLKESLKLKQKLGDPKDIAITTNNLNSILAEYGEYGETLREFEEILKARKDNNDPKGVAITLFNIALLHQKNRNYEQALTKYDEAMNIVIHSKDKEGLDKILFNIALIHEDNGEYQDALIKYEKSLNIRKNLGNQADIDQTIKRIEEVRKKL